MLILIDICLCFFLKTMKNRLSGKRVNPPSLPYLLSQFPYCQPVTIMVTNEGPLSSVAEKEDHKKVVKKCKMLPGIELWLLKGI